MKTILLSLFLIPSLAFGAAFDMRFEQRNAADTSSLQRLVPFPAGGADGLFWFNGTTTLPSVLTIGGGLTITSGVLSASGGAVDWADITNKPPISTVGMTGQFGDLLFIPTTLLGYGITDAYPLTGNPSNFLTASSAAGTYATQSALSTGLAGKFNNPAGTSAQVVRGDGSLGTPNAGTVTSVACGSGLSGGTITSTGTCALSAVFNFSQPASRSLSVSTSYQAADPTKAAVIYPSYACQNATQVLASSACTVQVRMGTSSLTCSTGAVYYTQSLTVGLGLLLTQNSSNPVPIFLPVGAHFIVCPTAGTFTVTTVEQTAAFN